MEEKIAKIVITKTIDKTSIGIDADTSDAVFLLGRALHVVAKKINEETGISFDKTLQAALTSAYIDDDEFDEITRGYNRLRSTEKAKHIDEMRKIIDEMESKHIS